LAYAALAGTAPSDALAKLLRTEHIVLVVILVNERGGAVGPAK
jgi:hypothetical protein